MPTFCQTTAHAQLMEAIRQRQEALAHSCVEAALPDLKHSSAAVERAIEMDLWALTERLLPLCQPKVNQSRSLHLAAERGLDWVELVLPYTDPKAGGSQALAHAALAGQAAVVARLLPLSDPSANQYRALRHALTRGHDACIDLLVPACDLTQVMAALNRNRAQWNDYAAFRQRQALQMDRLARRAPPDLQDTWLALYGPDDLPETADQRRSRERLGHLLQRPAARSSRPRA